MEADIAHRYRSRILREMKANRENPFNSPPSSTGSHGTVSPTMSSVFSEPDGESTRRLNEDIARITGPRKLPVNWEAAHRKWPEFYGMPKKRDAPIFDDDTNTRPLSAGSKENKPPVLSSKYYHDDDSTHDIWKGSQRTRAEMQPRVDNDSDLSSIVGKSPALMLSHHGYGKTARHPSPLAKTHNRVPSDPIAQSKRRPSISDALDRLRRASMSPKDGSREEQHQHNSPHMSSAKSSLTAVQRSPQSMASPEHNASKMRSFFMPDVSHLGDFVTGTLRFSGSNKNGVPIFVKHGKVHDQRERPSAARYAEVDGLGVPEDEEKIFVSMDMIREEILSLQEHHDKVQEYAENLQQQVERLEYQVRTNKTTDGGYETTRANEQILTQKNRLEEEVRTLQSRLEQVSRKMSLNEIENDSVVQEKDRALKKLQDACDDINKLTRKLNVREKELETSNKQLESSDQLRHDNDTLRRDVVSLKHGRDALELENTALRDENDRLKRENQALVSENISLRSKTKNLSTENDELRDLDGVQRELEVARDEIDALRQDIEVITQEKSTLREDNDSLVRHNENYFNENKILRRENSGFERSVHVLHDENVKLQEQVDFLKEQLDHCRPLPKEDFSAKLDEETEENMTSAFFVPDITINTEDSRQNTETGGMPNLPEITSHTDKIRHGEMTEQETRNTTRTSAVVQNSKAESRQRSKSRTRQPSKGGAQSKVSFSVPEISTETMDVVKARSNMANQGSKRRNMSHSEQPKASIVRDFANLQDNEDTTGLQSVDVTTQDLSVSLPTVHSGRSGRNITKELDQKMQRTRSRSRSSVRKTLVKDTASDSIAKSLGKDSCPALSDDARRVLDDLCEHNCRNCTVCARIASHRGILSAADLADGKKRVTVSRPVPVTDRDLSVEDPTLRPAHNPGHALALVIKGLEDESRHLQLELARLQAQYSSSDKALGRRERLATAEAIRSLLKRLEAKNDQIYSLYDVLEGQKAAGQAMSEDEIEMTVLNITGMTVRDVTSGTENLNLTWEGIVDV